ncbi:MAG: DEAD/DEAH box helicase [Alphaproteobacteria bacterium]|nr:DEAD/DEAH box helicase [Alphaproteobacteria bacterium]
MSAGTSSAFERLHPDIQRLLWRWEWRELNDAQERAVAPILAGEQDVVIAAPTGGGKTEAAYLPLLTRILNASEPGLRALYVAPLKALINDQHRRLEAMTEALEVPVHKWHGDVPSARKRKVTQTPSGVLLITPESLEAIFVNHGTRVAQLFAGLSHVVIDELHSFFGTERGRQLQSLLHRVELAAGRRVPRVGLSATLGDATLAATFLRPGQALGVEIIEGGAATHELRLQVRGYRHRAPRLSKAELRELDEHGREAVLEDAVDGDVLDIADHMYGALRGKDNLVFANRRAEVELFADLLRRTSERQRVPNEFWAHHGSLSRELREDAERALKELGVATAVCTSTLEMGIDIGTVHSVAQVGCPPSVAAMRQRLGRSGRRGDPSILRIYVQEAEITERSAPADRLRPELVQAVAMVRLMVRDRFCEAPRTGALHLSTMVQQLLSLIAQHGGVRAAAAFRALCVEGPFEAVDQADFMLFLRGLGAAELIEQDSTGLLLHGRVGERVVNHYSFYAAFRSPEEYRLVCRGRTLGSLPIDSPLYEGAYVVFGGRRWKVESVDQERRVIHLLPSSAGRPPKFGGGSGALVDDEVRREMLRVLTDGSVNRFVDPTGLDLLEEARAEFSQLGLTGNDILRDGSDATIICWVGDRALDTMAVQLKAEGIDAARHGIAVWVAKTSPEDLTAVARTLAARGPADAVELARGVENKAVEKYDEFVPHELLCRDYAGRALDVVGAWGVWKRLAASTAS